MDQQIRCPECDSNNVQYREAQGDWLCADGPHVFTIERPFVKRHIFISYGHDEHADLAHRLHADLVKAGHEVWIDAERLPAGGDWELKIEEGLLDVIAAGGAGVMLLLLTPYAVRRPDGYCLNEVTYAHAHDLRIVPVMVVETEPPLSIYRLQWLDMRPCIPIGKREDQYNERLPILLDAIQDPSRRLNDGQASLLRTLDPIDFRAEITELIRDFRGRKWVMEEIEYWLADPDGRKVFCITGDPGVGKSALSAWLREHCPAIVACHFCDFKSAEKRDPAKLVRSVACQLASQLPEYRRRLLQPDFDLQKTVTKYQDKAYDLFDRLIVQRLFADLPAPGRTLVVLIDALDEATANRQNEIAGFLSARVEQTPDWLRFLVTCRPNEPELKAFLADRSPLHMAAQAAANLEDLREFIECKQPRATAAQVRAVLERSEGIFLYVRYVCEELGEGRLSFDRIDKFPRGLAEVYERFFQRQFANDMVTYDGPVTHLLQPMMAAFEPLSLRLLQALCGVDSDTEWGRLRHRLGSLFPATGKEPSDTMRPFHRSLVEWLTDEDIAGQFYIAAADGHRALASHGVRQWRESGTDCDVYWIRWLPCHLRDSGRWQELQELFLDECYMTVSMEPVGESVHEYYRYAARAEGWRIANDVPWEQLAPADKEDNIAAAVRMPRVLRLVNLYLFPKVRESDRTAEEVHRTIDENLELLAEKEHKLWRIHKKANGWVLGKLDDVRRQHPAMVPYEHLDEYDRQKDRMTVRHYPDIAERAGYRIQTGIGGDPVRQ